MTTQIQRDANGAEELANIIRNSTVSERRRIRISATIDNTTFVIMLSKAIPRNFSFTENSRIHNENGHYVSVEVIKKFLEGLILDKSPFILVTNRRNDSKREEIHIQIA